MIFNSFQFFVFFAAVLMLYLLLSHRWQNRMLLAASYVFYGAWDWRFLSLILLSTALSYCCGYYIASSPDASRRRRFLVVSVAGDLSILGFFKYFNFFIDNLRDFLTLFGFSTGFSSLSIILPLGISFYTFQTLSYTIDIYYGRIKPAESILDFALFVSFFPQLVAGPIERARNLLPQVSAPRRVTIEKMYEGAFLIFWGLFQKIFIADNLARIVDPIFAIQDSYNGATVLLGLYAFAFQILCDFDGYSNIARGVAKCLGFELTVNFNLPYFASGPRDFWRRWHISLSTWLRDYLYIPLGGSRKGTAATYRNMAMTMFLGGLWHGANWTFVVWGTYHGILLIVQRFVESLRVRFPGVSRRGGGTIRRFLSIFLFFHLVCLGWLFFRAKSVNQAWTMLGALFGSMCPTAATLETFVSILLILAVLIAVQIAQFLRDDLLAVFHWPWAVRAVLYATCFYLMIFFGVTDGKEFIYFQF